MKTRLLTAVSLLLVALNCQAIEPGKRQSIENMLEAASLPTLMESVQGQMATMFRQQAALMEIPAAQRPVVDKYFARLATLLQEELSWSRMKEPMVEVYDRVYTRQEVEDLTAFYRTPVGRKMIEKMPELVGASQAVMQERMKVLLPKVQQISAEMQKELQSAP
jgi:hypothetical protein